MSNNTYEVFLINLDRSLDRLSRMEKHLVEHQLTWQRIEAIDGQHLCDEDWQKVDKKGYVRCHGKVITPNEVGCYLSHLKALHAFLDGKCTHAIIMEDDVDLTIGFKALWYEALAKAEHWDLLHLSGLHRGNPKSLLSLDDQHDLVLYLTRQTGAGAYAINRHAAKALVEHLLPIVLPFDHAFNRAWHLGIRQRAIQPLPANQRVLKSSTMDWKAIVDGRLPTWRRLPALWFRLRCEVRRVLHGFYGLLRWRCQQLVNKG